MQSTIDDLGFDFDSHQEMELLRREPVSSIEMYFIYIDSNLSIEKIVCENEAVILLENGKHGIHKNRLLEFIQQKRFVNEKKYKLLNFFHFHVPLEHEQLNSFIKNTTLECPEFMKSPSYLSDLIIENSMPIFQDVNSLFFFLKAAEVKNFAKTAKSALKTDNGGPRITKKVKFLPVNP